jgi:hypothetical protein
MKLSQAGGGVEENVVSTSERDPSTRRRTTLTELAASERGILAR